VSQIVIPLFFFRSFRSKEHSSICGLSTATGKHLRPSFPRVETRGY